MTDVLKVWLHDRVAGTLERRKGELVYVPVTDEDLTVAARGTDPWSPGLSRNWFDGLLPEGDRRASLAARFEVRTEDTFGLLAEIGWECAGAIAVLPPDRSPSTGTYEPLTDAQVGARLDELPSRAMDPDAAIRMSLGGAQEKLLLARRADAWALPLEGAPSTHILKPEPGHWPGLASAEGWALRVASAATDAAEAVVSDSLGSRPTLVVTRYDREQTGETIRRRHQEDLCQALGLPPGAKYATPPLKPRHPTLGKLAGILLDRAADPPAELVKLLEQVTVSVALANADAHAKNISLLHGAGGTVSLSPLYDVVPTVAFLPQQTHVGLPIAGKFKIVEIGKEHLVTEAVSWGIPERIARETVDRVTAALTAGVEAADEAFPAVLEAARDMAMAGIHRVSLERPGRHPNDHDRPSGRRPAPADVDEVILRS